MFAQLSVRTFHVVMVILSNWRLVVINSQNTVPHKGDEVNIMPSSTLIKVPDGIEETVLLKNIWQPEW